MIGVRLEPKLKQLLENIADEDERSLSNLVRLIIIDWLKTQKGIDWKKADKG